MMSVPAVGEEGKLEEDILQEVGSAESKARRARRSRPGSSWDVASGSSSVVEVQDVVVVEELGR